MCKRKAGPLLHIIYKHELKMIKDIHMSTKTIKFLEGTIGRNLYDVELGNELLT